MLYLSACAGNDRNLSVEEYAEWCADVGSYYVSVAYRNAGTWREAVSIYDDLIEQYQKVDPLESLSRYHNFQLAILTGFKSYIETLDLDADVDPWELVSTAQRLAPQSRSAGNALLPDVRAKLEATGCLDSGDAAMPTTPPANLGEVVPLGRVDAVVHYIERHAINVAGVPVTRVAIQFTHTLGEEAYVSSGQVRGIDTKGLKVEPYDVCHRYIVRTRSPSCWAAIISEDWGYTLWENVSPGRSVTRYIYFVESPVYPLEFIELGKRIGRVPWESHIEWVEPWIALLPEETTSNAEADAPPPSTATGTPTGR